jgi:hypothetical protein
VKNTKKRTTWQMKVQITRTKTQDKKDMRKKSSKVIENSNNEEWNIKQITRMQNQAIKTNTQGEEQIKDEFKFKWQGLIHK